MKKQLTFLFILISFAGIAQEVGIKAGPSYTVSTGNLKEDYGNGKFFFNAGVFTREEKGCLNFVFEAFFNQIRAKKGVNEFTLNTGNVAFLLETKGRVRLQAGPAASFNLNHSITEIKEYQGKVKPINIDATAGIYFALSDKVGLNARYSYGLLEPFEGSNYHPQSVQLSVNYMLKKF